MSKLDKSIWHGLKYDNSSTYAKERGSIEQLLAYLLLDPDAQRLNHDIGAAELIDSSALLRVRVDNAKKLNS